MYIRRVRMRGGLCLLSSPVSVFGAERSDCVDTYSPGLPLCTCGYQPRWAQLQQQGGLGAAPPVTAAHGSCPQSEAQCGWRPSFSL